MKNIPQKNPTALIILDGFGYSPTQKYNAIAHAKKPNFDYLLTHYPHTFLQASGLAVGLPENSIGNSETGHLTIGAGRTIPQPILLLNNAIADSSLFSNPILIEKFKQLKDNGGRLHCMGLLSNAGVHSKQEHLYAFLQIAKNANLEEVFIHAFLDGRDVAPQSAELYLSALTQKTNAIGIGTLGSIHGRFYAMDRDHNWQRTEQSYNVLTTEQEVTFETWHDALAYYYAQHISDEFIPPTQINRESIIKDNDGILFFNVRPDRARQLTESFINPTFNKFPTPTIKLCFFITPVTYHVEPFFTGILFPTPIIKDTLKECLSQAGKRIFSIAETEKYAHVTYFFNGGQEAPFESEKTVLIPSLPLKNYIHNPEMSAQKITEEVVSALDSNRYDFYLINYANADMVGHSGDFNATVKAIECLDKQIGILYYELIEKRGGTLYITGDHGKAEEMFDLHAGQPKKSHTTNLVYFIAINKEWKDKKEMDKLSTLADIAPFILKQMGIKIPDEMKKT